MITVITDGSADNKTKKGGWAAVVRNCTTLTELTGWAEETTSNRMELTAAVEALKSIPVPSDITVITDSAYLRNTMTRKWYERWFLEEHKTRPNLDLWYQLAGLASFHTITWVKVKGHSGDYWNDRVDKLADWARTGRVQVQNKIELNDVQCPELNFSARCRLYIGHSGLCHFQQEKVDANTDS